MTALEAIGFFWVVFATGIFTAAVLIASAWSITLGIKLAARRYRLGESMERTLQEPESQRAGMRLS